MDPHAAAQKLIIVSFFEDLKPGYRFAASNWPLHLTLVRPFTTEGPVESIETALTKALDQQPAIAMDFGEIGQFGPHEDVPVTTVVKTPELQNLHDRLRALMEEYGAVNNTQWSGKEYRPHVTHQHHGKMEPGQSVQLRQASLLDYQDGENATRTILRTYPFKAT